MQSQRVEHNWVTFTFIFRAALVAKLVKNLLQCRRPLFDSWVRKTCWRRDRPTHSSILGLSWWLSWQRIHLQCGRSGFDPWVGKIPWRRERLPTSVFWPGEFMAMNCMVHGVTKSQAQLSDFHFHFLLSQKAIPSVSCNSNLRHHRIRNPKCFSYHCRWKQTAGVFSWIFYSWPNHTFLYGIPSPNKRGVTKRHSTVSLI